MRISSATAHVALFLLNMPGKYAEVMNVKGDDKYYLWGRVPYFAVTSKGLTDGEFRLFALLTIYAFKTGKAWPTLKKLSEELGRSERTILRQLKKLQKVGVLEIKKDFEGNKKRNCYYPYMPEIGSKE